MASPPVIEDPAQASRRAKIRIGVAVVLLVTAVGILAVLNQRKPVPEPIPAESTPVTQESISSQQAEPVVPPAQVTETPLPSAAVEPSPAPATQVPPPPPVAGKLPPAALPEKAQHVPAKPVMSQPVTSLEAVPAKQKPAAPPSPLTQEKPAMPKAFEVQLGVFSDMENAKQLQAKLAEHGIPSHTETRVQVGPFKTRAEAEQARAKLKDMGISSVIAGQ